MSVELRVGQTKLLTANFPPSYAGRATTHALLNPDLTTTPAPAHGPTTTGVLDLGGGSYGVLFTPSTPWVGLIDWDTGGASPLKAKEDIAVFASTDADVSAIRADMTDAVGLLGKNNGLRDTIYLADGSLHSYNLFVYDTDVHATDNDGATGVIAIYHVVNTNDGAGNILSQSVTKVL